MRSRFAHARAFSGSVARALDESEEEADDDVPAAAANDAGTPPEHEYSFEGYSIEFNDKVALLPPQAAKSAAAAGSAGG